MENQTVKLEDLSAADRRQLMADLQAAEKAEKAKREADRHTLIQMENETVDSLMDEVTAVSEAVVNFKRMCIEKFSPLMKMKAELGKASESQRSYSFKTKDGNSKIVIDYNETMKYDDGIHAGVEYAKQWLTEKSVQSEEANMMTTIIENLLGKSRQGTYSPENLWIFVNAAEDYDVPLLKQAAESVKRSLYKELTSVSVKVYRKDAVTGTMVQLPLSATKA